MRSLFRTVCLLGYLCLLAAPVWAQDTKPVARPAAPDFKFELSGDYVDDAEVEGGAGSFSTSTVRAAAEVYDFHLSYENQSYDWSSVDRLPFGNGVDDPWDNLQRLAVGYGHHGQLAGPWGYFFRVMGTASYEKQMDDSWGAMGFAGVSYRFSPMLMVNGGGLVRYHPVDSIVLPMAGLTYNPDVADGLTVTVGFPRTRVGWRFAEIWTVSAGGAFDNSLYRLADDSAVEREGYLRKQGFLGFAALEVKPLPWFKVGIMGTYHFARELEFYNHDGHERGNYDVDPAWGGMVELKISF